LVRVAATISSLRLARIAGQLALGLAEHFLGSSVSSRIAICSAETVRLLQQPAQAPVPSTRIAVVALLGVEDDGGPLRRIGLIGPAERRQDSEHDLGQAAQGSWHRHPVVRS
jgi:hypothetical protein